jgi:hypothetical protein
MPWPGSGGSTICVAIFAEWVSASKTFLDFYFVSFFWFRVIFIQLVPCVSLVILNFLLFSAMRRAEKRRQRLMAAKAEVAAKQGNGKENKRQRDANNTTLMLIVVISVFLSVELPLMVMSILHTINSSMDLDFIDYHIANTVTMFINTCIFLSYPINFGIYCGMSR